MSACFWSKDPLSLLIAIYVSCHNKAIFMYFIMRKLFIVMLFLLCQLSKNRDRVLGKLQEKYFFVLEKQFLWPLATKLHVRTVIEIEVSTRNPRAKTCLTLAFSYKDAHVESAKMMHFLCFRQCYYVSDIHKY